jgi:hypothetical protein
MEEISGDVFLSLMTCYNSAPKAMATYIRSCPIFKRERLSVALYIALISSIMGYARNARGFAAYSHLLKLQSCQNLVSNILKSLTGPLQSSEFTWLSAFLTCTIT